MHKDLENLCGALDALANAVLGGWSSDQTFAETWGWNCPAITRADLADLAARLADDLRVANAQDVDKTLLATMRDTPRRLQIVQNQTVPQLYGGNNAAAVLAYVSTLTSVRHSLTPIIGWQLVPDGRVMPGHIARRLRSIQAEVDELAPHKEELQAQLARIEEAHEAAESLPVDLQVLREARKKTEAHAAEALIHAEKAKAAEADASVQLNSISARNEQAEKLVAQCEEAYRITTTKGLAAAFDQRATRLSTSLWFWVGGLMTALVVGGLVGAQRFEVLLQSLGSAQPKWEQFVVQLVFAAISVGAPIWFAWLATKQIGQRFRLAEDYAFKASVAKAYEGYRREAARIDAAFEARLFESALTRLEEAPLRLVEQQAHGSPWHELIASDAFRMALETVPGFTEAAAGAITNGASKVKQLAARSSNVDPSN